MTSVAVRSPLARPRVQVLSGVSAAVARHLGWRPRTVRALFVALTVAGGAGALLYLWLWALTPLEPAEGADADIGVRRILPVAPLLLTVSTIAGALGVLTHASGPTASPIIVGPIESAVTGVGAVLWTLVVDRRDPGRRPTASAAIRAAAAALLLVEGAVLLVEQNSQAMAVIAVALIVLGAAILVLPRFLRLWEELLGERSARVREEQRAEIAAHLHDSVLQTLALIQNRAGPGSEIARIARAQERELRDWLFAGTDPFAGDLATELHSLSASLELEHAVRIEVVTVGEANRITSAPIIAAAREALTNAARHAGGDISVYAEVDDDAVEVFVRDRGPGFEPSAVPDGRIGIRESIVGRMQRAGGSATVHSGSDGTEVLLRLPRGAR